MTNVFRGFCSCCLWTILVFKKRKKNPNTKNSLFPYRTPEGLKLQEEKVGKKIQFSFNVCVGVEYFCSNFLTQTWVYTLERVYCCRISKRLPPNAHLTVFSVTNCRFFFFHWKGALSAQNCMVVLGMQVRICWVLAEDLNSDLGAF